MPRNARFRTLPGSTKAYLDQRLRAACGITFDDIANAELSFDVIRGAYLAAASDLWEAIRFERTRLEARTTPPTPHEGSMRAISGWTKRAPS